LNDQEGLKGDFASDLPGQAISVRKQIDGLATTTSNSEYLAVGLPAPSAENLSGRYYKLKVQKTNQPALTGVAEINNASQSIGLFSQSPYTLNAGANNIISNINFVSYGNPDYFSSEFEINPNCHQQYSKLILAQKCIGKTSCSFSLSDFENYDTMQSAGCSLNLGNGLNGNNSTEINLGGTGAGGGGNSNAISGINNVVSGNYQASSSYNGNSYCDNSQHVQSCRQINEFDQNFFVNKGLKLDNTKNLTDLNGKSGIIEIWLFSEAGGIIAMQNRVFSTAGVHEYTVPAPSAGMINNTFYIKYVMSGAGGGGGGSGEFSGTDGFSGSRITGMFKVESGKIVKFYVGGGGNSGKTYCPSSSASVNKISIDAFENSSQFVNKIENKNNLLFDKIIVPN
jgi:hypothetical protein